MKLSLDWIKEYVGELPDEPKAIGLKMTLATAEIEGHERHGDDVVYDIDNKSLTHRPDLWGHYGFAREVAAVYKQELKSLDLGDWTYPAQSSDPLRLELHVDPALCPRYCGLVVDNVTVGPSPDWLVSRLEKAGARSVNNLVDLTNYVMFELGQPMHVFDRRMISGELIQVRLAMQGERVQALDGQEYELSEHMLVIADAEKPVALAGVMGGSNSEVIASTTTILLESANFHPAHVRRTATALGIRTESSMRFEKGLDPEQADRAIRRYVSLLLTICPQAKVVSQLLDATQSTYSERTPIVIPTHFSFIRSRLGINLDDATIADILTRLCFQVDSEGDQLIVTVPAFRATGDVSIPEDLVEEVGRVYGFDNIPPVAPLVPVEPVRPSALHSLQRQLRQVLSRDLAFHEVFNYAFVGDKVLHQAGLSAAHHLALANPLASDQHLLRTSLVPNMLKITGENLRFRKSFRIYELERVFTDQIQSQDFEHDRFELCGLICQAGWKGNPPECFYTVKGALEDLLAQLPVAGERGFVPAQGELAPWCHPGRTADVLIGGQKVGYLTQVHPQVAQNFDIKAGVGLFVLDVGKLLSLPAASAKFVKVQKYPTVPFDISLICDQRTLIGDVRALIASTSPLVRQVELFDVYSGDKIGEGKKSLAFNIVFAAPDHTLQPAEIDDLQNGVIATLEAAGYQVRKG
ncbi:MAG: phenylalanine--tRNA ligase subunit beta [Candidatus Melainabacteria bacterium HGW-Melainabacteria-1]|nr:MAG: phenylalanine--tRNA ligase subunit beta [Candidatus Melainabacteria bacterium HGW-Melainabacteria-1]